MVAFSSISARPRYRNRASAGSVPFVNATLQLASLGTTSISANVSLQRRLAGRIPTIAFSNLAAPPSTQRASVPDRLNIGNATPQSFGDPANLAAFGKDISETITDARVKNIVSTFGIDATRQSPGSPVPRTGVNQGIANAAFPNPFNQFASAPTSSFTPSTSPIG